MNEKWKSAFDQIHAEKALKEHTKQYLSEKIYSRRPTPRSVLRRAAVLAAGLVLLFFIGGSWVFMTPTAYISIDINPSLELGINCFNRIVSVEGYNEDGDDLAESLDITFMNYSDALDSILSSRTMKDYLTEDAVMSLTVAGDDESQYAEIFDTVENCASGHENIRCHSGSTEEMHEAHDADVSFGKYQAYLILKDLDPSISLDDIRGMTMREIYDLIDSCRGNQKTDGSTFDQEKTGADGTDCRTGTDADSRLNGRHGHDRYRHDEHEKREGE